MSNELVHKSQGTTLTQAEYENVDAHICNSQATGDVIYASSATQLTRLGIGATNQLLMVTGGVPVWGSTLTLLAAPNLASFAATNSHEFLRAMLGETKMFCWSSMYAGWTDTAVNGGSVNNVDPSRRVLRTGATAAASILTRFPVCGLNSAGAPTSFVDWGKKLSLFFSIAREYASDANAVSRAQLKTATAIGALGAKGIGLQIDNLALTGEAYGTSLGTVGLSTTMTIQREYWIEIRLESTGVTFLVNNVSKGTITTAGKFPTGMGAAEADMVFSHNDGTPGVDTELVFSPIIVLQGV